MLASHARVRDQPACHALALLQRVCRAGDRQQAKCLAELVLVTLAEGARAQHAARELHLRLDEALHRAVVDEAVESRTDRPALALLRHGEVRAQLNAVGQADARVTSKVVDPVQRRAAGTDCGHTIALPPATIEPHTDATIRIADFQRRLASPQLTRAYRGLRDEGGGRCCGHEVDHTAKCLAAILHARRTLDHLDPFGRHGAQATDVTVLRHRTGNGFTVDQHEHA